MSELTDLQKLKGDKYSKRLRLWIKNHSYESLKVIWLKWDILDGIESKKGSYYLIFDDEFGLTCAELNRITTIGNKATGCFIRFGGVHPNNIEKKDVTDWFVKNYKAKGACLIHSFNHNFVKINKNSRKCKYCGKIENRTVESKTINKRIESWT